VGLSEIRRSIEDEAKSRAEEQLSVARAEAKTILDEAKKRASESAKLAKELAGSAHDSAIKEAEPNSRSSQAMLLQRRRRR